MFSNRFGLRTVGRNTYYMYRTAPQSIGVNLDPQMTSGSNTNATDNNTTVPPDNGTDNGNNTPAPCYASATRERLLICLHDDNNCEHVNFVKSVVRSDVHFQSLNMATPIYRMHSEVKMMLWRMFSASCVTATDASGVTRPFTARKLGYIGIMIYPLVTYDELECILNNVLPMLRGYYCFAPGQTRMDVVIFTLVPTDSCFTAKLAVVEETLKARIHVVCLGSSGCCTSCASCADVQRSIKNQFFAPNCTFEHVMDLTNLVEQLEKKLICLGNVKGLMVSSKMQNIFNRMLYIEDKYRKLHHNIMSETCYDGMLGEIEHIESKIKEISAHIPISYTQGYELIQKLTASGPAAVPAGLPAATGDAATGCGPCAAAAAPPTTQQPDAADPCSTRSVPPQPPADQPVYSYSYSRPGNDDNFFIPGRA